MREVTITTPPNETPTPAEAQSADFATAVKFTKLSQSKYKEANVLVVPESPATRYLAHQTLIVKAEEIGGYDRSADEEPSYNQTRLQAASRSNTRRPRTRLRSATLGKTSASSSARSPAVPVLSALLGRALDAYDNRFQAEHKGQAGVGLSL
jgi:hypothetical protein